MRGIAVTSGKGGTGTSCVAAYLGAAFAKRGKKTLLVETGATARTLDIIVAAKDIVFDIADVANGSCGVLDAAVQAGAYAGLSLLAGPPAPAEQARDLLGRLQLEAFGGYDIVIFDTGCGAPPSRLADTVLMVTTPDTLSVRACERLAGELYARGESDLRLVINQVPAQVLPMRDIRDFDDIIDRVGARLIAVVPFSPRLRYGSNNGAPVSERSLTVQIFDNLAARLSGDNRPLLVR